MVLIGCLEVDQLGIGNPLAFDHIYLYNNILVWDRYIFLIW